MAEIDLDALDHEASLGVTDGDEHLHVSPVVVLELVRRLRAAESELAALRQQEPAGVFYQSPHDGLWYPQIADPLDETVTPLYAAPGAQPAVSVPRFPTMLRKMWSGHEVQEWLDANIRHVVSVPDGSAVQTAARIMNVDLIKQRDALLATLSRIADGSFEALNDHEVAPRMQEIAREAIAVAQETKP